MDIMSILTVATRGVVAMKPLFRRQCYEWDMIGITSTTKITTTGTVESIELTFWTT